MYCVQCGAELKRDYKHCPSCGLAIIKPTQQNSSVPNNINTPEVFDGTLDPEYLHGFAWPLFTFPWLYMLSMKYRWYEVIACMALTPLSGLVLLIAVPYAAGGRKRAYRQRDWKSDEDFMLCQRAWDSSTRAYWQLILLISVISILVALYNAYSKF